jgi:magnesium transporter
VAASAISGSSPTKCQARTRLYRNGVLELEGFPVAEISDHLADESSVIWLDLRDPDREDLAVLSAEFGLHPLAVEDAVHEHERPKLDRYKSHLFLAAYAVHLDTVSGELSTSELAAFITDRALITVRKDDGLDIGSVIDYWDASPDLAKFGVGYLLHGLIDNIVDGHFNAVQMLDDTIEDLEDRLFSDVPQDREVQRRSFELRKSLVLLRRVVLPMREVVNALMRRDLRVVDEAMHPYYQDVYDHVLRVTEWTESLRDLVATILETNLTIQGNRMNVITKKVTSWAAIVAVPTFVTGFYGMNVPYPGFGRPSGVLTSVAIMVVIAGILYVIFKRRDWL